MTRVVVALCAIPKRPAAAPAATATLDCDAFFKNCLRVTVFIRNVLSQNLS